MRRDRCTSRQGLVPLPPASLRAGGLGASGGGAAGRLRSLRFPAISAISVLALALPVTLGDAALAATTGGVTISCTNTDPILGPLQSSATLAAGTSGFLQLGGINGGKGQYVGNCTLNGIIPSGWKVAEASWVALSATSGSGNAGTFTLSTGDTTFVDSGTFTNSGTFEDDSSGLTQMIEVGDFVNTGSVITAGGSFGTAGAAYNPPCPKCRFVDKGTVLVEPKQGFSSGSIFVLAKGGTIKAQGGFGITNESTFDVEGGSVTAGVPTSTQFLGLSEPSIEFGTHLPSVSKGTIDITELRRPAGRYPQALGVGRQRWVCDSKQFRQQREVLVGPRRQFDAHGRHDVCKFWDVHRYYDWMVAADRSPPLREHGHGYLGRARLRYERSYGHGWPSVRE